MPCETFRLGDGSVAIVCSRGRRGRKCSECKRRDATKQCDFPLSGAKAGKTCDRYLCDGCAVQLGNVTRLEADPRWTSPQLRTVSSDDTVDYCPAHARHVEGGASTAPEPPKPTPPKPQVQLPLDPDFIPPTKGPRTR